MGNVDESVDEITKLKSLLAYSQRLGRTHKRMGEDAEAEARLLRHKIEKISLKMKVFIRHLSCVEVPAVGKAAYDTALLEVLKALEK